MKRLGWICLVLSVLFCGRYCQTGPAVKSIRVTCEGLEFTQDDLVGTSLEAFRAIKQVFPDGCFIGREDDIRGFLPPHFVLLRPIEYEYW